MTGRFLDSGSWGQEQLLMHIVGAQGVPHSTFWHVAGTGLAMCARTLRGAPLRTQCLPICP